MNEDKLGKLAAVMERRSALLYRQLPFYQRIFLTRKAFLSAYLQGIADSGSLYKEQLDQYTNQIVYGQAITNFIRGFFKGYTEESERIANTKEEKTIH